MKENSIKEDIERLKLCSTNQCYICGRYEKEECMLERNRCESHILSDYERILKENEELKNKLLESEQIMRKNSIEEDIKIIENLQKDLINLVSKKFVIEEEKRRAEIQALSNILSDYKKLLKENKLKDKIIDLMAEMINNNDIDEDICNQMGQKRKLYRICGRRKLQSLYKKNF